MLQLKNKILSITNKKIHRTYRENILLPPNKFYYHRVSVTQTNRYHDRCQSGAEYLGITIDEDLFR